MSLTTRHIKVKGGELLWGNVRLVTKHGEQRRAYMKGALLESYSWRNVRLVTKHGEQRRAYMKGALLESYSWRNVRLVTKHGEQRRTYMKGGLLPERIGLPHSVQKKQAAHLSRVPQLVGTCCPEFVVWTTPAGPDAGRHRPRDRPAGAVSPLPSGSSAPAVARAGPTAGPFRARWAAG
jgi:hypothetical protein